MRVLWATAALAFLLDQALKWLVVQAMSLNTLGTIEVAPPYLVFRMAWNTGVNFGLMAGDTNLTRWALVALALAISTWVVVWVRHDGDWRVQVSAGLLVGGALGNVVDRVIYGAVADFLNMSCCGIDNPFSFNVADIAVFLGAVGLAFFARQSGPYRKTP